MKKFLIGLFMLMAVAFAESETIRVCSSWYIHQGEHSVFHYDRDAAVTEIVPLSDCVVKFSFKLGLGVYSVYLRNGEKVFVVNYTNDEPFGKEVPFKVSSFDYNYIVLESL